jgi:hypothetical protein
MPVKGGTKCIKYLLFGFNFIFWVSECDCRARLYGATCSRPQTLSAVWGAPAAGSAGSWHRPRRQTEREEKGR